MNKTAQQTSEQGILVTENPDADGSGPVVFNNSTELSPGTSDTPQKDASQITHGEEGYPGIRPGGLYNSPGEDSPAAGDVDPGSTKSATETGQDGNLNDIGKKKAFSYNG